MNYEIDPAILTEYQRIMENEARVNKPPEFFLPGSIPSSASVLSATEVYKMTLQIAEIAKSCLVPRGYVERFNLNDSEIAHESVGAHTLLVMTLVDRALSHYYSPEFGNKDTCEWPITLDGYSYREIMEAVRIHDLPENEIGDIPDNGSFDRGKKDKLEYAYLRQFSEAYPDHEKDLAHFSLELFTQLGKRRSNTGRLIFLADKAAALIISLCYDSIGMSPVIHENDSTLSKRDIQEMEPCDYCRNGYYKGSEMWAVDYFHIRKFAELDHDGFFTAIIVMYTLIVNGRWYSWREKDYEQNPS